MIIITVFILLKINVEFSVQRVKVDEHRLGWDVEAGSGGQDVVSAPLWFSWRDVVRGKLFWCRQHFNTSTRCGSPRCLWHLDSDVYSTKFEYWQEHRPQTHVLKYVIHVATQLLFKQRIFCHYTFVSSIKIGARLQNWRTASPIHIWQWRVSKRCIQ